MAMNFFINYSPIGNLADIPLELQKVGGNLLTEVNCLILPVRFQIALVNQFDRLHQPLIYGYLQAEYKIAKSTGDLRWTTKLIQTTPHPI
jgi:hypothetical protein